MESSMENEIRSVEVDQGPDGKYRSVQIVFGPHYFIDLRPDENQVLTLYMGYTHHGFKAHAADVMDELEKFIEEIRKKHHENAVD
jgi:hypothetical protein